MPRMRTAPSWVLVALGVLGIGHLIPAPASRAARPVERIGPLIVIYQEN